VIITYKGFNADWTCRGFQYEVGQTYTHDGNVEACSSGFHACEHPLDVFLYYAPAGSKFAQVEQSGTLARHDSDSKVASSSIRIVAELNIAGLIKAAVDYTFSRAKPEEGASATGYRGAASATGSQGAASATGYLGAASATGDQGAASATGSQGAASATGYRGAASATGYLGAASATGDRGAASATGYQGAALAAGSQGRVMGAKGCAIFLAQRGINGKILHVWAGIVGRDGIKPDTWYTLKAGKPVEVKP
jgi:hypothetical protein